MTLLKPTVDQELEAISTIINRMHEGLPELRKEAKAGDPKHTAQLLAVLHQGITGGLFGPTTSLAEKEGNTTMTVVSEGGLRWAKVSDLTPGQTDHKLLWDPETGDEG